MNTSIKQHDQHIKVSFNLSADDLRDTQLSTNIELLLRQYSVDGRNLEIEITEST